MVNITCLDDIKKATLQLETVYCRINIKLMRRKKRQTNTQTNENETPKVNFDDWLRSLSLFGYLDEETPAR